MAHINAITTNEQIFNPMTPIQHEDPSVLQKNREDTQESQTVTKTRRVQKTNSTSCATEEKNNYPLKPYQPPIPIPGRSICDRQNEEYMKFSEHVNALQVNILLLEAIAEMPKYARFLKELLINDGGCLRDSVE